MPAGDRKLTMDELGRIPAGEYATSVAGGLCLVLDNVRSRMNVGSIFRTADAFGVERLVLAGFTPRPPHREIEKTALGATVSVPWTGSEDTLSAVQALQRDGWTVYAVEQTRQALPFTELDPALRTGSPWCSGMSYRASQTPWCRPVTDAWWYPSREASTR